VFGWTVGADWVLVRRFEALKRIREKALEILASANQAAAPVTTSKNSR
jgi:hypothetical protein